MATLALGGMILSGVPTYAASQQSVQPKPQKQNALYTFKVTSDLVLVSVTAVDRHGNPIRDLKESDFTVLEDGKPQRLASFDVEDVQSFAKNGPAQGETTVAPSSANLLTSNAKIPRQTLQDRRLIVLFFDMSSLQPDDLDRAVDSATKFVDKQMTPADLVSVVTYDSSLQVSQDFTSDKAKLKSVLAQLSGVESQGMGNGDTGASEGTPDTGAAYTVNDTEYNVFNADRKLQAIQSLAEAMSGIDQKKSIIFFSSGLQQTGTENQAQLRAAVNTAVMANVSLYPVDARGLQAFPPGGGADTGSLQGTSAYSGKAVQSQFDSNFGSQETLSTIADDTGGKAFLDTNDFSKAYTKVQNDNEIYYVLGYRSTNPNKDGRYRHITVKIDRPDVKLEYRKGYYGPRDFKHFTQDDREQQMDDEMSSDLPDTDLPVFLSTDYFRNSSDRYYLDVSIVVPGSAIPFVQQSDKDKASFDVYGLVREASTKIAVGSIRQTVKLDIDGSQQVRRRNVQYNTGFVLPPGRFHLKFIVRENQTGKIGSFETNVVIPDLHKSPLKMSSVVIASQRIPAPKKKSSSPLVSNGEELIPNVAHVFTTDQPMYFYYEVYDPSKSKGTALKQAAANTPRKPGDIRVLTSIQFFKGKVKAYETPLVEATSLTVPNRKAASFEFKVPASQLKPGWYTCQVNVIDDAGGTFAFPRLPLLVRPPASANATK